MSDYLTGRDEAIARIVAIIRGQLRDAFRQGNEYVSSIAGALCDETRISYRQGFIDAIEMAYREGLAKTRTAAEAMKRRQPPRGGKRARPTHGHHPSGPTPLRPVS